MLLSANVTLSKHLHQIRTWLHQRTKIIWLFKIILIIRQPVNRRMTNRRKTC